MDAVLRERGKLLPLSSRVDPIFNDLHNGIKVGVVCSQQVRAEVM